MIPAQWGARQEKSSFRFAKDAKGWGTLGYFSGASIGHLPE